MMRDKDEIFRKKFNSKPWSNQYIQLTPYKNMRTKIYFFHKPCLQVISIRPDHALTRNSCKYCNKLDKMMTYNDLINKLDHIKNGRHYIPNRNTYTKATAQCIFTHTICGHRFSTKPNLLLAHLKANGSDCKYCAIHNETNNTQQFKRVVKKLTGNEYTVLSHYVNEKTPVRMLHNTTHPHTFMIRPDNFKTGYRCPVCAKKHRVSHGEHFLNQCFKDLGMKEGVDYYYGYVLNCGLHADFYIPSLRLAVEFDGQQHYHSVNFSGHMNDIELLLQYGNQSLRDNLKDGYCYYNNIQLVRMGTSKAISLKRLHNLVRTQFNKKIMPILNQQLVQEV